jgi:NADH-quinone oxidoreductase subunit C
VSQLSSAETPTTDTAADTAAGADDDAVAPATDERREALADRFAELVGDVVVERHIRPGDDLWLRIDRAGWAEVAEVAKGRLGMRFFDFLSAIDWMDSPFARDMEAIEDLMAGDDAGPAADAGDSSGGDTPAGITTGYAGGDTRFQLLARVYDPDAHIGVTFKCDLPDDDLSAPTWSAVYLGANWHERETWEMFGITFTGHPDLTHLYLPGEFEGHPLRKDFPLLARRVKPWPGIVDVEPLPSEGDDDDDSGDAGDGGE